MPINFPIQMYDPKREYKTHKNEIDSSINKVLDHGIFINGPEINELETNLKNFTGSKHAIAVSNGTDALKIALLALGVKPGDEVITVAHSWISTAEVISIINAIPVFVDIEPKTFNLDIDKIQNAITEKTKAIIIVSLYGQVPDMDKLNNIVGNIPVIEDAAQSFGASYKGCKSGNLSTIGATSFFPSKPLGCYGDGGACFTNNDDLAMKMRAIKSHGGLERFKHKYIGFNGRLDTIQAAILNAKFKYFDETLLNRAKVAQYYTDNLKDVLITPHLEEHNFSAWAQYSLICKNTQERDSLFNFLKKEGINLAIFYPTPLHTQECFAYLGYKHGDLPITEEICSKIINLPCYGELTQEEQDYIIEKVKLFFNEHS